MNKKTLFISLSYFFGLLITGCQGTSDLYQVTLVPDLKFVVASSYQNQPLETKAAYDNQESFMLAVYDQYCACSAVFHSVVMDYMNQYHLPFYEVVADDDLLYDFGLPIGEEGVELPLFAIYELGNPFYTISNDSGHSLFTVENSFVSWVEQRINFTAI